MIITILMIVAVVCLFLQALNVASRVQIGWLGLAVWATASLLGA